MMATPVVVIDKVDFQKDIYRHLLKGLLIQRHTGDFCDIIIRVNGIAFFAHKAILAIASPYFKSMFSSNMKESSSCEIDMSESFLIDNNDAFKRILDYLYTGELEITGETVDDLLRIGDFLLIDDLKDYCKQFYLKYGNLTLNNCLSVSALSEQHNLEDVALVSRNMIKSRFHDYLIFCDQIIEMPPVYFSSLLQDDEIVQFTSSDDIIKTIIKWYYHKRKEREKYFQEILLKLDIKTASLDVLKSLNSEGCIKKDFYLMDKLNIFNGTNFSSEIQFEDSSYHVMFNSTCEAPPSPGYLVEITESLRPVIIAMTCNVNSRYLKLFLYSPFDFTWRFIPISSDLLLHAIPPRLNISSITMYNSMLYLFLSFNLPYPSDLTKINVMCVDIESGMHSLLCFKSSENLQLCCKTTLTDDKSVPPVMVYCNNYLCVLGNCENSGNLFLCDMKNETYVCYSVPGVRFISLARAHVQKDRYVYIWCRHRFGHEEYCINKEVSFLRFDCLKKSFNLNEMPGPPNIFYCDFAEPYMLSIDEEFVIVHSPGKLSMYYDKNRNDWQTYHAKLPNYNKDKYAIDLPFQGCEVHITLDKDIFVFQNPAPFTSSLLCLQSGSASPIFHPPPPVDCISLVTSGYINHSNLDSLQKCRIFDDSYTRLFYNRTSTTDYETEDSGTPHSPSESDYEYDRYFYDDEIYGYYDEYG